MSIGQRVLVVAGPVLLTATWFALGAGHDGYSQVDGTISVLAAYGAPGAGLMVASFLLQAAAMLVTAGLLRVAARPVAVLLAVNGAGTVAVALARTTCGGPDADWCRVSEHPLSAGLHVAVASVSLLALAAAPWVALWLGRDRVGSLLAAVVGTPMLVAFGVGAAGGWAEKGFVTVAIGWAAWAGRRAAVSR